MFPLAAILFCVPSASGQAPPEQVLDLSVLVSPRMPAVWPTGMLPHSVTPTRTFGAEAYHRDMIVIDEHTGTQWDAPAHFVPPPDSGLPGAGPNGLLTCEKVPAWQFCGEACVIDVSDFVERAEYGASYLISPETVQAWERKNRPLKFGDVVLFRSGYTDKFYQPLPRGERLVHLPLRKGSPAWPAPMPETMTYLGSKGVMTLGLDSPSMGPLPDLAVATHQAGGKLGMIWTEMAINLGKLPTTGAFYAMLPAKHAGGSGSECRSIAITEPKLAARLIESARNKRVADLSVTLHEDFPITWPGYVAGEEACRYLAQTVNAFNMARGPYFARAHILDGLAGTHVVLPSFSLPPEGFDNNNYSDSLRKQLNDYEAKFGRRGHSAMSPAEVPLAQMMGEAHVVDVRTLVGSTRRADWPASPQITVELLQEHEKTRPFQPGEIVLFYSGYSDAHYKPLPPAPELDGMFAAPLAGKAEGWPAPTPEAIHYLAEKGIKCLGTDSPMIGGVNREQALQVYWLAASKGVLVVEYLTNLASIADKEAYFIFAPIKIAGTRGGYGRAIALY